MPFLQLRISAITRKEPSSLPRRFAHQNYRMSLRCNCAKFEILRVVTDNCNNASFHLTILLFFENIPEQNFHWSNWDISEKAGLQKAAQIEPRPNRGPIIYNIQPTTITIFCTMVLVGTLQSRPGEEEECKVLSCTNADWLHTNRLREQFFVYHN